MYLSSLYLSSLYLNGLYLSRLYLSRLCLSRLCLSGRAGLRHRARLLNAGGLRRLQCSLALHDLFRAVCLLQPLLGEFLPGTLVGDTLIGTAACNLFVVLLLQLAGVGGLGLTALLFKGAGGADLLELLGLAGLFCLDTLEGIEICRTAPLIVKPAVWHITALAAAFDVGEGLRLDVFGEDQRTAAVGEERKAAGSAQAGGGADLDGDCCLFIEGGGVRAGGGERYLVKGGGVDPVDRHSASIQEIVSNRSIQCNFLCNLHLPFRCCDRFLDRLPGREGHGTS